MIGEHQKHGPYQLDEEELRKCDEAFSTFDNDNSGMIDAPEIRLVMEMMGQSSSDEDVFKMISELSPKNRG